MLKLKHHMISQHTTCSGSLDASLGV